MRKMILGIPFTALLFLAAMDLVAARQPQFTVELITTFDYPIDGIVFQSTGAINTQDDIVGAVSQPFQSGGFMRFSNGTFSQPLSFPGAMQTSLLGINDERLRCGFYIGGDGVQHGFLDSAGVFTSYDVPGAISTTVESVNNSADFSGNYQSPTEVFLDGFVSLGGAFSTITIPEAGGTVTRGINNRGQVVGWYLEEDFFTAHGFLRARSGTLTYPIDFPGTNVVQTDLEATNDRGFVVGGWVDDSGIRHGLILQLPDTFVSFDVVGSDSTILTGINNSGAIAGWYYLSGIPHGLIARLHAQ